MDGYWAKYSREVIMELASGSMLILRCVYNALGIVPEVCAHFPIPNNLNHENKSPEITQDHCSIKIRLDM